MIALARAGEHAEAAATADEVVKRVPNEPRFRFEASCTYAMCRNAVEKLAKQGQLGAVEAGELAKSYGTKSVESLQAAVDLGWKDAMTLHVDPDLDGVRDDPRFQAIVNSLPTSGMIIPSGPGQ